MPKCNGYKMSAKNVKIEVKEKVDNFQGVEYGNNEKNQSFGNLTNTKNKLNSAGRKDIDVSIQLPNKSKSPTKAFKDNKNFPVILKKQAYAPKNKRLEFSGKMKRFSPKQTNLKPFPGIRSSLNTQEKSNSNSTIAGDDADEEKDDDDVEKLGGGDDDAEKDESSMNEDDKMDMNSDDAEKYAASRKRLPPENVKTAKRALTNNKDIQKQIAKNQQMDVIKNKAKQAKLEMQTNALLHEKEANSKGYSALIVQKQDNEGKSNIDYEDDIDEDENVVRGKVTGLKKCTQSKIPESGNEKSEMDLKSRKEIKKDYPTELPEEIERRKERDSRHLFVKGYPADTTKEDLKALSRDILYISFPTHRGHKAQKRKASYCFMGFKNEKITNKNYELLQGMKINGQGLVVDFCGSKSKNMPITDVRPAKTNFNRLTCYNIPKESTIVDVAALFPKAISLRLSTDPDVKNTDVLFQSSTDAAEAFKSSENAKIRGKPITVMFSKEQKQKKRKFKTSRPGEQQQEAPAGKRFKQ